MEQAIQVSKNFVRGEKIKDPFQLLVLAGEKKSVYHTTWGVKPASVMLSMQCRCILNTITEGRLFTIIPFKSINH